MIQAIDREALMEIIEAEEVVNHSMFLSHSVSLYVRQQHLVPLEGTEIGDWRGECQTQR